MYGAQSLALKHQLDEAGLLQAAGFVDMSLLGITFRNTDKSVIGYLLQGWLGEWMKSNGFKFRTPTHTQLFPDFYLGSHNKSDLLEIKCFDLDAGANFDIANFEAYCDSLQTSPERIGADYLIFGYRLSTSGLLTIEKMWLKKIWEITSPSGKYPIKTQNRRNVIYNIRPASWEAKSAKYKPFGSGKAFLNALYRTLFMYRGEEKAEEWRARVNAAFGSELV